MGKKSKAHSRTALATEAQRRAVESHEEEAPERFLCLTWKRAEDSNLALRKLGQDWVLLIPLAMVLVKLWKQDNQIKVEISEKQRYQKSGKGSALESQGERKQEEAFFTQSTNSSLGADVLERVLGVLRTTQHCLKHWVYPWTLFFWFLK